MLTNPSACTTRLPFSRASLSSRFPLARTVVLPLIVTLVNSHDSPAGTNRSFGTVTFAADPVHEVTRSADAGRASTVAPVAVARAAATARLIHRSRIVAAP